MEHRPENEQRVVGRSNLLPEEQAAGSDDPEAQAAAVLADSDARSEARGAQDVAADSEGAGDNGVDIAPDSFVEHRSSNEATPPPT